MGCDIHMHVEYRPTHGNPGYLWRSGDYYKMHYRGNREAEYTVTDFCGDRDYWLFAVLADVRNDGSFTYIDGPRGLPKDISEDVKREFDPWTYDAHSMSYLTLQEIIDFYDEHQDEKEGEVLYSLINKLKERADELNLIYNFTWKNNYDEAYRESKNFRIVFWFDN